MLLGSSSCQDQNPNPNSLPKVSQPGRSRRAPPSLPAANPAQAQWPKGATTESRVMLSGTSHFLEINKHSLLWCLFLEEKESERGPGFTAGFPPQQKRFPWLPCREERCGWPRAGKGPGNGALGPSQAGLRGRTAREERASPGQGFSALALSAASLGAVKSLAPALSSRAATALSG